MVSFSGNVCVYLLFSVLGASNGAIISPGSELKGPRAVISFADHHTTEDRRANLQRAQIHLLDVPKYQRISHLYSDGLDAVERWVWADWLVLRT